MYYHHIDFWSCTCKKNNTFIKLSHWDTEEESGLQNFVGSRTHNNLQNILPHNWFEEGGLSGILLSRGKEWSIKFHMCPNIDSQVKLFALEAIY